MWFVFSFYLVHVSFNAKCCSVQFDCGSSSPTPIHKNNSMQTPSRRQAVFQFVRLVYLFVYSHCFFFVVVVVVVVVKSTFQRVRYSRPDVHCPYGTFELWASSMLRTLSADFYGSCWRVWFMRIWVVCSRRTTFFFIRLRYVERFRSLNKGDLFTLVYGQTMFTFGIFWLFSKELVYLVKRT